MVGGTEICICIPRRNLTKFFDVERGRTPKIRIKERQVLAERKIGVDPLRTRSTT